MRRTTPLRWLALFATLFMLTAAPSLASARAWLGVYSQEVTDELRDALELPKGGVLVSNVVTDSPAERAGLRKGDVITAVDNTKIASPEELSDRIAAAKAGDNVSLSIVRKGSNRTLSVRLTERPAAEDAPEVAPTPPNAPRAPAAPHAMRWYSSSDGDSDEIQARLHEIMPDLHLEHLGDGNHTIVVRGGRGRLGVRIETLTDDLAQALGASGAHGVLVVEVFEGTAAEKAGLKAGDVITTVDGTTVSDTDDLSRAMRDKQGKVSISVIRRGEKRTVTAEIDDAPRVIRLRDGNVEKNSMGSDESAELQKQMEDLRQQLRELREELNKNQNKSETKSQTKSQKK